MEHYGPAPAPLEEKRDMYQEAIEELLDSIYYLTRQVARLEDQREKLRAELKKNKDQALTASVAGLPFCCRLSKPDSCSTCGIVSNCLRVALVTGVVSGVAEIANKPPQ